MTKGFSLVELLIAVMVSSILVSITVATFGLFRRSMNLDQNRSDISQNARVALDRVARELRQTPEIVTVLPASQSDTSISQPGEIIFEDGNQINSADTLTYRRYYVVDRVLKLDVRECFFSGQATRVKWNAVNGSSQSPTCQPISGRTQDIAQNINSLAFYGNRPLQVVLTTSDGSTQSYKLQTSITSRNL